MILNKLDILFICKMQPVLRALVLSKLVLNKPDSTRFSHNHEYQKIQNICSLNNLEKMKGAKTIKFLWFK